MKVGDLVEREDKEALFSLAKECEIDRAWKEFTGGIYDRGEYSKDFQKGSSRAEVHSSNSKVH